MFDGPLLFPAARDGRLALDDTSVLVITGGNIDTRLLANVLLRDLARNASGLEPGEWVQIGIALQDGAKGEMIRVKNDKSEKAVSGRVVANGRVEVNTTPAL